MAVEHSKQSTFSEDDPGLCSVSLMGCGKAKRNWTTYVIVPASLYTPALPAPSSLPLACYCWQVSDCSSW